MKDGLGQELAKGDEVVCANRHYQQFDKGIVERMTAKRVFVLRVYSNGEVSSVGEVYYPQSVLKHRWSDA